MFIKCKDHVIAKVLVDNGSSLNVLIKVMLNHLLVDTSYIWMSKIMACSIDGSSMQIIGDIIIELEIDLTILVTLQVIGIPPSYNMLLGKPWIHLAGTIHSVEINLILRIW
jgi:hypothetical protein